MKTKLVLWGTKNTNTSTEETETEAPEKVLIALELKPEENKVEVWVFEGETANEEFSQQLLGAWRKGEAVAFPEHSHAESELSASSNLLPEEVKAEKEELLKRTQTEWLFIVLSTKLFKNYEAELLEWQEKVDALEAYNKSMWEGMKEFWAKVQTQMREQNLFREHANILRDRTNEMFAHMKKLRSVEDAAFEKEAKENHDKIAESLAKIETELQTPNVDLHRLFESLKGIQRNFRNTKLTRALRSTLWERIDGAFKAVKAKRFPGNSGANSGEGRLARRIEGLKSAIKKMEESISRDTRELQFQNKKIESGNATQLETQLREVRAKLIQERIDSKDNKLLDMNKTLKELDEKNTKWLERQKQQAIKAAAEAEAAKKAAEAKKQEEEAAAIEAAKKAEEVNPETPEAESSEETSPETEVKEVAEETKEEATAEVVKPQEEATEENSVPTAEVAELTEEATVEETNSEAEESIVAEASEEKEEKDSPPAE